MTDSTETSNLEDYGVWVKRPPQDADQTPDISDSALEDFDIPTTDSISDEDLQVVDDSDLGDFAAAENAITESESNTISDETMSFDEISVPNENIIPDFSESVESSENPSENQAPAAEEIQIDMPDGEIDLDSFMSDSGSGDGEINVDDFMSDSNSGDGEISLDDFMGGSGSGDGEISLDDFLDDGGFNDPGSSVQKQDDVQDNTALDIKINFTENEEDKVETRDITEEDDLPSEEIEEETTETPVVVTESASPADFGTSEDVDLSDFGIDSDAEETPVTDNIKNGKKNEVIDYDLAITEEDMTEAAPVVEEIISDAGSSSQSKSEGTENVQENTTSISNELLKQIVQDLSGLKNEITTLKNDFLELKAQDTIDPRHNNSDGELPGNNDNQTSGFFESDDQDDTIALSGDELTNIVNNAGIAEEPEAETEETVIEEPASDETFVNEEESFETVETPVVEESFQEEQVNEIPDLENTVTEEPDLSSAVEETVSEENTASEEIPAEETISDENFSDENPFGDMSDEFETEEETDSGLSIDLSNEALEEPDLNNVDDSIEETEQDISIPVVDEIDAEDMFVESSGDEDFIESINTDTEDNSEETIIEPAAENENADDAYMQEIMSEEPSVNEALSDENISYLSETENSESDSDTDDFDIFQDSDETIESETVTDEPVLENESISEDESFFEDFENAEENPVSETESDSDEITEDPIFEEEPAEETVTEDAITEESVTEEPVLDDVQAVETFGESESFAGDDDSSTLTADELGDITAVMEEQEAVPEQTEEQEEIPTVEALTQGVEEPKENVFEKAFAEEENADETVISEETQVEEEPEIADEPIDIEIEEPAVEIQEEPEVSEDIPEDFAQETEATQIAAETAAEKPMSDEIKQEVKSVLLYMDQLLQNLPEDKIMEFAKSEQFETYKKLFADLGLTE